MRPRLQHPLLGGLVLAALTAALLLPVPEPAPARPALRALEAAATKVEPMAHKGYTEKVPNTDITFDLMPIPGGTFLMGSPEGEKGREASEGPQHPVGIKPFWMGKCEVSWDEFDIYRKEKGVPNPLVNDEILKKNPNAITGPT